MPSPNLKRRGVTLIELIVVILIISFGLVGLAAMFSDSSSSLASNEVLQQASQYAQECAERALAERRSGSGGFGRFESNNPPFSCSLDPTTGFAASATVAPETGAACPTTCRTINIKVNRVGDPLVLSDVTVMLAQ